MNVSDIERTDKPNALMLTAVLVVATFICSFLVTHAPRTNAVWLVTLFLCWIEALYGLVMLWRRQLGPSLSGAMSAIIFTSVGGYTAVSLASVIAYLLTRDSGDNHDSLLFGILLFESVVLFVILHVLVVRDKIDVSMSVDLDRIHSVRSEASDRVAQARKLLGQFQDGSSAVRVEGLSKKLYAAQCALSHSHNPGLTPSADADIHALVDALCTSASSLNSGIPISGILSDMEQQVNNLETLLRRNGIS